MKQHTETPYLIIERGALFTVISDGKQNIALIPNAVSNHEANVQFIVKACNNHEKLVAALRNLLPENEGLVRESHAWAMTEAEQLISQLEKDGE